MGIKYLGASSSRKWLRAMDDGGGARPAPEQKRPRHSDGELVELLWQNGAVVAQAQARRRRPFPSGAGGDTGGSGVTGEEAAVPAWVPDGGALGGDVFSQLWHSITRANGRVDRDMAASAPPVSASGAESSRTAGEVGSSFCGSNLVTAAPAQFVDDDIHDAAPPPDAPGASTSRSGWGSNAPLKRGRDEFDGRSEDADFEAVDESRPARRPASKRRTRAAEVHNLSERRRRDRINEKMRALQELVPHCNKTDKASILDEAIEYLKSLQLQVQIMWMTTGVAPMMLPGANQLMPPMTMGLNLPCMPPVEGFSQMQRVPPFMNNPLLNQMPQISSAAANVANVANHAQRGHVDQPRNPFLHHNDAVTATPQVPGLFSYGSQLAEQNEIQELLAGTAAPALDAEPPSSSDGTGT
ncbi:hypothetical protein ACP70R_015257 [Stipagrostis hirtigluma subsp. patula]